MLISHKNLPDYAKEYWAHDVQRFYVERLQSFYDFSYQRKPRKGYKYALVQVPHYGPKRIAAMSGIGTAKEALREFSDMAQEARR